MTFQVELTPIAEAQIERTSAPIDGIENGILILFKPLLVRQLLLVGQRYRSRGIGR